MTELERHGSVPRALDVSAYAAARLRELWHLQHLVGANRRPDSIGSTSGNGRSSRRIFQLLPWHVRRRTMSFTARRVPRRWRLRAEAELARQPQANRCRAPSKHRRRTRRYYRQSSWLLADRSELESPHGWLETHIWHAKRMHMFEPCWGGRLAWAPCDRGLGSFWRCACRGRSSIAWRLASDVCALYDASWYRVIEVPGDLAPHILPPLIGDEAWARLCSEPVFRGLKRLVGTRIRDEAGNLVAAQVEWLWEPLPLATTEDLMHGTEESGKGDREVAQSFKRRRLWAFVHPLSREAVLALMIRSAEVSKSPNLTHSEKIGLVPDSSAVEAHQNVGIGDEECSAASLSMSADRASGTRPIDAPRMLTDGLVRFEFYGVRSTETLYRVLRNARAAGRDWA
ncbi:Ribonucleases P/MRP protein subunit pop1 [Cyanidiococcus yangmingshanensis]|uniref:Ribonucleases P/MRP protein subunit pop1 n=1 Tax=Cyanidiococcus yangmingshanensis TaxID=2690220 RepID=A0A7J7IPC2_9RHOD|nr:Ribonucleases P/MRP protein subunit pop1 [Cyanidiococcus yangmingshanensis]